jgi:Copper transport outer membrane protein, MctB
MLGYSARYHVASLAAVFLALGIGILIGTGLGKNVVNDTTRKLESSLKGDLESARAQASSLRGQLRQQQEFAQAVYPALTRKALAGARLAVIALGGLDDSLRSDIEHVLGLHNGTGARLREFAVVREPPDLAGLNADLRGTHIHPLRRGNGSLPKLGRRAGHALLFGGPFFRRVSGSLLARRSGNPGGIGGVVVARTSPPDQRPAAAAATSELEAGILDGLAAAGVPAVGVERTDADPSSMSLFHGHGLTTVDDLDLTAGQVSLVYALRGARGSFGIGAEATRLLPPLRRILQPTEPALVTTPPPPVAGNQATLRPGQSDRRAGSSSGRARSSR